jgi:catechol 2,3-dioxygenase-like lactoylglutathione lyase family enzyme
MKLIQKSKALYSAAWLHLALCSAASAGLTSYDGFDYGATTGDLTGKNSGSGWSGAYTDIGNSTIYTTPGLTYTGLPTTGGAAKTADGGGATTINFRSFNTIYGDNETETCISFLARRNGAASTATFAGLSFYNSNGIASTDAEVTFANGGTVGFACSSPEQADAWHAAGVANGGTTCEDPPGVREGGMGKLYLAYLRDPDGNKLVAVHRGG